MLSAPPAEACFTGVWASVALRQKGLTGRHRSDVKSLLCVRPPPFVCHPMCAHSRLRNVHHVHISTNLFDYGPAEEIGPAVAVQVTARPRPPRRRGCSLGALHSPILCTHSCPLSLSYSRFSFYTSCSCSLEHCFTHTHMHRHAHAHTNSLKDSLLFTHPYNSSLPYFASASNPTPSTSTPAMPATLPLGAVSRNGLKELAPCT